MKHNWEYKKFGSICNIIRGGSPRPIQNYLTDAAEGLNWIKIGDVAAGSKYITSTKEKIKKEGLVKTRQVFKGDFILSNSMSFGRPYILKIDGCIHDGWLAIKGVENHFIADFLYYFLSSPSTYSLFEKLVKGGVVSNLNSDIVKSIDVPVPPMAVQEQIVGELDKINELIDDCRELLRTLDNLAQSIFYDSFGDYYNGSYSFFKPIKEVFETITDFVAAGSFASLRENVIYKDSPNFAQLVRTMDIKSNFTKGQFVYVDKHAFDFLWRVNLNSECIILPNIGVNCGEVYHLKPSYLRYKNNVLGPNAILIRSSCYNHKFLSFALKHDDFQKQLSKITSQVAQPKFNKTNLKELNILVPPLSLQEDFAERIELIDAQKKNVEETIANLQTLLDSRMDYWFN